jgi:rhamnulokinase
MTATRCAAVDLGAASGRVVLAEYDGERLSLREASRFETPLGRDAESGLECWDLDAIEARVLAGLRAATSLAPVQSVGVDTWGVDYVLLDERLRRVGPAVSYRDRRTTGMMEEVFARIPPEEIYRRTGIQFQTFNTLYQLAATARRNPEWLRRTRHVLLLANYLHFRLCGAMANEYTNATTTQMYNIEANDWDDDLLAAAGVSREVMAPVVEPGTVLGEVDAPGGSGSRMKVVAPGTHDTASAVAAVPLEGPDEAFISSGTWSLMGIESRVPFASEVARHLNFANEGGVERRYRVLKNIVGLWLVQRIRQESGSPDHSALVEAARAAEPWRSLVDPEDPRFLNPTSMTVAIRDFCAETGQPLPEGLGGLARCAIDSLALSYRRVKGELETLRNRSLSRIHIVGGGSQNRLLDQLCADACQLPVSAGPVETSAFGNACVQFMALGAIHGLAEARAIVRRSSAVEEFRPREAVPEVVWERFQSLARPRFPEATSDTGPRPARSPGRKEGTRS